MTDFCNELSVFLMGLNRAVQVVVACTIGSCGDCTAVLKGVVRRFCRFVRGVKVIRALQ